MEHVLSAFHPKLAHGAGLILLSDAYFEYLIEKHACDEDFVTLAKAMGNENAKCAQDFLVTMKEFKTECGVSDMKMSDFEIEENELTLFSKSVFKMTDDHPRDPYQLKEEDFLKIYQKSFR